MLENREKIDIDVELDKIRNRRLEISVETKKIFEKEDSILVPFENIINKIMNWGNAFLIIYSLLVALTIEKGSFLLNCGLFILGSFFILVTNGIFKPVILSIVERRLVKRNKELSNILDRKKELCLEMNRLDIRELELYDLKNDEENSYSLNENCHSYSFDHTKNSFETPVLGGKGFSRTLGKNNRTKDTDK